MSQQELIEFFKWAQDNLKGFTVEPCDESKHFYLNEVRIGGWAGDSRVYFYDQNDELARALRMMDAATSQ